VGQGAQKQDKKGAELIMEYKNIEIKNLLPFPVRSIRQNIIEKLKERIEAGYNPARPLSVIRTEDGKYLTADGNHRLTVLQQTGAESAPCIIYDDEQDPYALAIKCNQDEDTYAPMDLFDWLDFVAKLKSDGLTQAAIGERIGMAREVVAMHVQLLNSVVAKVLDIAKQHEDGRATKDVAIATKFTLGWFRNSGLYDLNKENQLKFMDWFVNTKASNKGKNPKNYAAELKLTQDALSHIQSKLLEGADGEQILSNIEKGLYKDLAQVEAAIKKANEQFLDRQKIQILHQDGLEMLQSLPDKSVDCILTDPPYNVTSNEWDQFDTPEKYMDFLRSYMVEFKRVLKNDYHLFLFVDSEYMARTELLLNDVGFEITSRVIWVRKNMSMGRVVSDKFISQWEPAFHCGTKPLAFPQEWGEERGDVQVHAVPQTNFKDQKVHPTQKPISLIKHFLKLATDIGDMVVDPFCGGGTTAKACEELNRKCITSDISEEYVNITKIRIFGGSNGN
jgi:site-specific DNA-methyltransferase (adenine-specific)